MTEHYKNIAIQLVADDETDISKELVEKSIFFRAAFSINLGRVIGPAAPDLDTQALGELWQDVPSVDGVYDFEIATVLPFYLPDFEGKPEFAIGLPDSELIFSSRMIRCFYSEEDNNPCPLQYYLCHRLAVHTLQDQKRLIHIHPVPLRTFVSKRVSARCRSAESAVQEHFYSWINEFIISLSHVLDAIRATSKGTAKHLLPQSATPSLPVFWICVIGDKNCIKAEQFGVDLPSSAFRSLDSLDQESVNRVHELVANNTAISTHESSLALARTYLYYGYDGLAIVQICIACEAVLAQMYESFLASRGVSKKTYADAERDITFSQLLNLHLPAARDLDKLDNYKSILCKLNWARKHRNDMVHKGSLQKVIRRDEIESAIEAATNLIGFLINEEHIEHSAE
jgi:hypothetical protein